MKKHCLRKIYSMCVILSAAALILSSCGRRGAPDLPASAYMQDENGAQVKKPREDKPFIADGLIR